MRLHSVHDLDTTEGAVQLRKTGALTTNKSTALVPKPSRERLQRQPPLAGVVENTSPFSSVCAIFTFPTNYAIGAPRRPPSDPLPRARQDRDRDQRSCSSGPHPRARPRSTSSGCACRSPTTLRQATSLSFFALGLLVRVTTPLGRRRAVLQLTAVVVVQRRRRSCGVRDRGAWGERLSMNVYFLHERGGRDGGFDERNHGGIQPRNSLPKGPFPPVPFPMFVYPSSRPRLPGVRRLASS